MLLLIITIYLSKALSVHLSHVIILREIVFLRNFYIKFLQKGFWLSFFYYFLTSRLVEWRRYWTMFMHCPVWNYLVNNLLEACTLFVLEFTGEERSVFARDLIEANEVKGPMNWSQKRKKGEWRVFYWSLRKKVVVLKKNFYNLIIISFGLYHKRGIASLKELS